MTFEQILLTVAITLLTTISIVVAVGVVSFFVIARKVKAHAAALRKRRGVPDAVATRSALAQVKKVAWLMDSSIPVGGGHRIGVDGIIDFVPGVGDLAGVLVSAWIIYRAAASGAPQAVLLRMAGNVGIDALLGAFPVLGVIADSAFKANIRNVALFEEFLNERERTVQGEGPVIDIEANGPLKKPNDSRI